MSRPAVKDPWDKDKTLVCGFDARDDRVIVVIAEKDSMIQWPGEFSSTIVRAHGVIKIDRVEFIEWLGSIDRWARALTESNAKEE